MALHYQVIADFSWSNGRPSLVGLSLNSTKAACTLWPVPGSLVRFASNSRIFHTLKEAHAYISYLMGLYPDSPALFPELDTAGRLTSRPLILPISARPEGTYKGQLDLFSEVSQ